MTGNYFGLIDSGVNRHSFGNAGGIVMQNVGWLNCIVWTGFQRG